jgi:hypothetical protein
MVELCRGVQECPAGRRVVCGVKFAAAGTVGDYLSELGGEMVHMFSHDFPRLGGEPAEGREQFRVLLSFFEVVCTNFRTRVHNRCGDFLTRSCLLSWPPDWSPRREGFLSAVRGLER